MTALIKLICLLPQPLRLPALKCLRLALNAMVWAFNLMAKAADASEAYLTRQCSKVVRAPYDAFEEDLPISFHFPFRMEGPFWR
jgi:hypothetical protein